MTVKISAWALASLMKFCGISRRKSLCYKSHCGFFGLALALALALGLGFALAFETALGGAFNLVFVVALDLATVVAKGVFR